MSYISSVKTSDNSVYNIHDKQVDCYYTATTDSNGRYTVTIPSVTELYDGMTIKVYLKNPRSSYNTLKINNLPTKLLWYKSGQVITSHYDKDSILSLTYMTNASTTAYTIPDSTSDIPQGTQVTDGFRVESAYYATTVSDVASKVDTAKMSNALPRLNTCHLFGYTRDGLIVPLAMKSSSETSYSTAMSQSSIYDSLVGIDTSKPLRVLTSSGLNYNEEGIVQYHIHATVDLRNIDNCVASTSTTESPLGLRPYKPVYIRGLIKDDGLFYPHPLYGQVHDGKSYYRMWTQDILQNDEGSNMKYMYWMIGIPVSNASYSHNLYQIDLCTEQRIYYYDGISIKEYTRDSHIYGAGIDNQTYVEISGSESTITMTKDTTYGTSIYHGTTLIPLTLSLNETYRVTMSNGTQYHLYCHQMPNHSNNSLYEYIGDISILEPSLSNDDVVFGSKPDFVLIYDFVPWTSNNSLLMSTANSNNNLSSDSVEEVQNLSSNRASGLLGGTSGATYHVFSRSSSTISISKIEVVTYPYYKKMNDLIVHGDLNYPIYAKNSTTRGTKYCGISVGVNTLSNIMGTVGVGYNNTLNGQFAMAMGVGNTASTQSIAIGFNTSATGLDSYSDGYMTTATGQVAHAGGYSTLASGTASHSEGYNTKSTATASHAEGYLTEANANMGHSEGEGTISNGRCQHVSGRYNIVDDNPIDTTYGSGARKYIDIIGNGLSATNRSNAYTLDWDGNGWYQGNLTIDGGTLTLGDTQITEATFDNYVEKITQATAGNIAILSNDGGIDDGGVSLSNIQSYKGQVNTFADLPTTGMSKGDTYTILFNEGSDDGSTWMYNDYYKPEAGMLFDSFDEMVDDLRINSTTIKTNFKNFIVSNIASYPYVAVGFDRTNPTESVSGLTTFLIMSKHKFYASDTKVSGNYVGMALPTDDTAFILQRLDDFNYYPPNYFPKNSAGSSFTINGVSYIFWWSVSGNIGMRFANIDNHHCYSNFTMGHVDDNGVVDDETHVTKNWVYSSTPTPQWFRMGPDISKYATTASVTAGLATKVDTSTYATDKAAIEAELASKVGISETYTNTQKDTICNTIGALRESYIHYNSTTGCLEIEV